MDMDISPAPFCLSPLSLWEGGPGVREGAITI
ncbi:hypothetical protein PSEUDO8O_20134 [Pseudomonas sp. 8O]|nr:hypothetical protein PSEUDO8O_20134 [Pseudomonas sp. 8O]